jgi:ferredoxin--NADP+ reductase
MELMTPEQIAELRQKRYNANVVWLRKTHSDLMILRIQPDYPVPLHKPGQYSSLGLGYWEPRHPGCQDEPLMPEEEGKLIRRAYSIGCSVLDEEGRLLDRTGVNWL